ncbi:hypothetical protein ATO8_19834 [Roseivivax marinus]|uniref:Uncharacterized protein n=1 Tax=Roseivivax marinus TaxID=1379903 RepID=W4HDQ3_9RHOB|nr:hypothetical protein [Roseivivax marinus]ETW10882.1 hypothetical protein ATO8_19834 [Roseivivax marinus]
MTRADDTAETIEDVCADAIQANGIPGASIVPRVEALAGRVISAMRREGDPALLASVAGLLTDSRVRVAFLEAIGARLI